MYASNQKTPAKSITSERPPMLEKGSYVPWVSRFMRFLDNKQEEGERMQHSIGVGPYERKMIQNPHKPDDPTAKIIEPLSEMTESNKKQYFSDIRVINFFFKEYPMISIILSMVKENLYLLVEDKLIAAMMLLAREITQHYSTPTNNHLRTSSNTRNQAVIQDGRVDIQSKNVGYAGNDEVGGNLNEEKNDFMLDNHYGDDSLEELKETVIMMAHIQQTDDKDDVDPTSDVDALGESGFEVFSALREAFPRLAKNRHAVRTGTTFYSSVEI
ncbi:hypothetical protein Tco_0238583 [Tanacetum coccineum]